MVCRQNDLYKKKLLQQLLLIGLSMLTGMTLYEALKQVIAPRITVWESHVVTIVFSILCALTASFFIIRKQNQLNGTLVAKNIEGESLRTDLEESLRQLEATLANVKILHGLLPICASCKKIRDDQGYWEQIESYIRDHSEAEFTHSLCPDCVKKLYPDFVLQNRKDT